MFIIGNALDVVQERLVMKAFKVTGEIKKPKLATPFTKEVLADKSEHAVEKVYAEIGSKHRVKRFQIKIAGVQEMQVDEIEDPVLKKLVTGEA
ncbi:MAG: 50S ribosomal protein L18Ae [Candidatus Bathyarchaeota archaeon]|nr:50S ribosomal protein L18Ae [Candidatus Bathyarchaeota archaeon]